jgi:hypothetical protein
VIEAFVVLWCSSAPLMIRSALLSDLSTGDRRQASIHVALSQPIRRIYEKPFRSSPAFGSRIDLLNGYSRGNR